MEPQGPRQVTELNLRQVPPLQRSRALGLCPPRSSKPDRSPRESGWRMTSVVPSPPGGPRGRASPGSSHSAELNSPMPLCGSPYSKHSSAQQCCVRPPPIISLKLAAKWRIQVLRTTVTISDHLPENTKQYAEQRGTTASRESARSSQNNMPSTKLNQFELN